ncbi:MAG: zf-TFIIB domain-containing protein [Elusimicrobia bacterium]|nr:zf-TFIIB domain-containing protein [Elusimicrobiota bacterium]
MSEADVYRCPSCGAAADPKKPFCAYCGAKLSPVRCPWCFGWLDSTVRDCPRCGASTPSDGLDAALLTCAGCRQKTLSARVLGGARLAACRLCGGVWADADSFQTICRQREAQAAVLGTGVPVPPPPVGDPSAQPITYRPCPVCAELMNRFNFAGSSGVVLDACKPHGVWFDPDELRRIVAFIRAGGLDAARRQQVEDLERARRQLQQEEEDLRAPGDIWPPSRHAVGAATGLLSQLFGL